MDLSSSDIDGDLPDISSLPLGEMLSCADTALAHSLARIAREMASTSEVIAAGFQSVIAPPREDLDSAR